MENCVGMMGGNVYEWEGYKVGNREDGRSERSKNMEKTAEGRKKGKRIAGVADAGGKGEVKGERGDQEE